MKVFNLIHNLDYVPEFTLKRLSKETILKKYQNTLSIGRMQAREYFLEELKKQVRINLTEAIVYDLEF